MRALHVPDGGTPDVIDNLSSLRSAISQLASGEGPIAIDAERASGFRYSARAYLIQLFRRSGGLHLIDPIAINSDSAAREVIAELNEVIGSTEVVIHASTQDLPCLREFGINPQSLFDTELGARIAGCARVGLGSLCETLLDIALAKEHSAVDWSIRPLQQEWLDYAALDVAILVDLRDKVAELLDSQGKSQVVTMGSYGIGVTRALAAIAEQSHDEIGIIWPDEIAPARVHIVATGRDDEPFIQAERIGKELEAKGISVMIDDRREASPGVKFKDAELIGIPVIIVVGKSLAEGKIELRNRKSGEKSEVAVGDAISAVTTLIASLS